MRVNGPYLKVEGGIVVVVDVEEEERTRLPQTKADQIKVGMTDGGLVVMAGDIEIFLAEDMLDYVSQNRNITVYPYMPGQAMLEPALSVELSVETMAEAKGAYGYWKMSRRDAGVN